MVTSQTKYCLEVAPWICGKRRKGLVPPRGQAGGNSSALSGAHLMSE
jgi:hypothetical protein